jgi:hypothetical protein
LKALLYILFPHPYIVVYILQLVNAKLFIVISKLKREGKRKGFKVKKRLKYLKSKGGGLRYEAVTQEI